MPDRPRDTPTHGVHVVQGEVPEGVVPPSTSLNPPPADDTALREQLRDALLTHPWNDRPRAAHSEHRYDADCAICQGDIDAIASVALHVVEPTALAAEVDAFHAESLDVANDNLRALLIEQRQRAEQAVRQRDGFYTDLTKAERTLAGIAQMCRTALIPPVNAGEAVLARRVLARIDQPEGTTGGAEAAVQRVRDLAEQAKQAANDSFSRQLGGAPFPASLPADDVLAAIDRPEGT